MDLDELEGTTVDDEEADDADDEEGTAEECDGAGRDEDEGALRAGGFERTRGVLLAGTETTL